MSPYVGLRAIESGEALFGWNDESVELLNQVIADRVVLMDAVSGAGKTSLLKAGVVLGLESREYSPLPVVQGRNERPAGLMGSRYTLSVLLRMEVVTGQRFRTKWDVVEYIRKNHPDIDLTRPLPLPRRFHHGS